MCLYPKKIINKKYTVTEKNGGCVPLPPLLGYDENGIPIYDERVLKVEIPCGQCIECRETKAREWQCRLAEEIQEHSYNYFVTLTFDPGELREICKKFDLKECNAVAGYAVRHMLERWRKDEKKSLRHWFITELGHEGTERLHLHGLIFSQKEIDFGQIEEHQLRRWKYWKYGNIYVGEYVNERTINYISKYITKIDTDHKGFVGQILASPGIGKAFIERLEEFKSTRYDYVPKNAADYYRLTNGSKIKLPKYYKNKLYNEDQREEIWRDFMDRKVLTISGHEHKVNTTASSNLKTITELARKRNRELEYGDDSNEWRKRPYNITKRMLEHGSNEYKRKKYKKDCKRKGIEPDQKLLERIERYERFIKKL